MAAKLKLSEVLRGVQFREDSDCGSSDLTRPILTRIANAYKAAHELLRGGEA